MQLTELGLAPRTILLDLLHREASRPQSCDGYWVLLRREMTDVRRIGFIERRRTRTISPW